MTEERSNIKLFEGEFREIEIEDQTEEKNPSILYIPKSVKLSSNTNFQSNDASIRNSHQISTPMIIPMSERDVKFNQCIRYSKFIRIMSVLECLFTFIFLICPGNLKFLMILVIVPLVGFWAGRSFKVWLTIAYFAYLILLIILRIVIMVIVFDTLFTTLEVLVIVIDIVVLRILWKFMNALRMMTDIERRDLRILQNGVRKPPSHTQQTEHFSPSVNQQV